MKWKWTPKPSAELCRRLAGLKQPKNLLHPDSTEKRVADLEKKFLSKLTLGPKGCIEIQTAKTGKGYRSFFAWGKRYRAHRFAWLFYRGEIEKSLFVCHSCDNPRCVNLDHLWLGTNQDNMQDASKKKRLLGNRTKGSWQAKLTHCLRGHLFSGENLVMYRNGRICLACRKIRKQKALSKAKQVTMARQAKRREV